MSGPAILQFFLLGAILGCFVADIIYTRQMLRASREALEAIQKHARRMMGDDADANGDASEQG